MSEIGSLLLSRAKTHPSRSTVLWCPRIRPWVSSFWFYSSRRGIAFRPPELYVVAGVCLRPNWVIVVWGFRISAWHRSPIVLERSKARICRSGKGSRALQRVLAIVILLASVSGMATVLIYERASQPSVIIDTGIVSTAFATNSDLLVRGSKQVFNFGTKPEIVSWGRNESELSIEDLRVRLKDRGRPLNVNLTATGLDYVTYIHAAHLATSGDRDPFLILVITGRATGRRAQVVLLNPEYKVVYQHRIERFWNLGSSPLEIRLDSSSQREVPVVGPTCEKSLVLRVHETKRR